MLNKLLLAITLTLASCTLTPDSQQGPQQPPLPQVRQESPGESVERHLAERYNDTRANCGAVSQPAFLCNGVIFRGTAFSNSYHSWDNSLLSHQKGAVSFSYLRKDSRYNKLAYGYVNGYIFLPVFYANGKLTPQVLCAFPIDAATNNRTGTGCGDYPGVAGSGPCQSQNIYNASAWIAHYTAGNNSHTHQCGFDVRDALDAGATTAFTATLQAMLLIGIESFHTQNELRLAVWPDGQGHNLPLEAFFYLNDSARGRTNAQNDQRDFKQTTGLGAPVISLWLPKVAGGDATFKYLASDQVITLP